MDDYIANLLLSGAEVKVRDQSPSRASHIAKKMRAHYKKIRQTATISQAQRNQKALLYLSFK